MNKGRKKIKKMGSISSLMLLYLENEKSGHIHSIFKNSFNIKFGVDIVHISGNNRGITSFGCTVSGEKIKDLLENLEIGNIVIKKSDALVFYKQRGIEKLDLSEMEVMDLKIFPVRNINDITEKIMENIEDIDYENKIGIRNEKSVIEEKLKAGLTEENQKYLTGRGKGLTPAGDDIMLGYSFISRLSGENVPLIYGDLTTDISRQYFDALNKGYVSGVFFELLSGNTEKAVKSICGIGHTSGYDTLFGIYMGIKNLQKLEEII